MQTVSQLRVDGLPTVRYEIMARGDGSSLAGHQHCPTDHANCSTSPYSSNHSCCLRCPPLRGPSRWTAQGLAVDHNYMLQGHCIYSELHLMCYCKLVKVLSLMSVHILLVLLLVELRVPQRKTSRFFVVDMEVYMYK